MSSGDYSRETVGDYLRRERESRRVSLEEIAQNTRISQPYLEALERNDFRFFSRTEYIQGFLRGYARYIGLDPNDVLKRYELQMEISRFQGSFQQLPLFHTPGSAAEELPEETAQVPPPQARKGKSLFSRSVSIQVVILAAALILSFFLYRALKQLDQEAVPSKPESILAKEERKGTETKKKLDSSKEDSKEGKEQEKGGREAKGPPSFLAESGSPKPKAGKDAGKIPSGIQKGKVLGNPESKMYYLPGMKGYEKILSGKKVEFNSEDEAHKKGYRKATN